ncbi:MAG: hypothetical protein RJA10_2502 [Pseudomonadota bacterium]|jgi:NTE family protein
MTHTDRPAFRSVGLLLLASLLAGCAAMAPINPRVEQVKLREGHRVQDVMQRKRAEQRSDTLVVLAFSGRGTRAAAFSYGVLAPTEN